MTRAAVAGVGVVACVALATLAARHAGHPESSPVTPSGHWAGIWIAAVVAALVLYGTGTLLARRTRLAVVLAISVAVQVTTLGAPLLLSKDAYLYWNQARLVTAHGANPYRIAPAGFASDPSYPFVSEAWRARTTEYKPLWEMAGVVPALAAGRSAQRAELGYRILAALGVLAAVWLVARATCNARAAAFVGWNPLVALHFGGGGHNDAWLAVLLAISALAGGRASGGAALSAATFYKGFPGLLVPLELARVRLRASRGFWLGLAVTAAALTVGSFALFGTAWLTTAFAGTNTPSGLGGVHWLEQLGLRYRYAVGLATLAFACVYVALVHDAWRSGRSRFSLATSALCLTAAQLRPWYALWPVVLAGAEEDALAAVVAFCLTAYLLLADAVRL